MERETHHLTMAGVLCTMALTPAMVSAEEKGSGRMPRALYPVYTYDQAINNQPVMQGEYDFYPVAQDGYGHGHYQRSREAHRPASGERRAPSADSREYYHRYVQ